MEEWKNIPNYKGYQISSYGRVKSNKRGSEKILKTFDDGNGYESLTLYKNNKPHTFKVHVLVAIAFLNHKPNKYETVIDHIDSNKSNNSLTNLRLVSHRENIQKELEQKSGLPSGVYYHKKNEKYVSKIRIKGKDYFLGSFTNLEDASKTYKQALENFESNNILPNTIIDKKTSKEKYISFNKGTNRWVYLNKKISKSSISFLTEEEAIEYKRKVEITFEDGKPIKCIML